MTAKDSRHHDDWQNDPENPLIPFRMSDRLIIHGLEVKVNVIVALVLVTVGLVGAGMAFHYV